MPGDIQRNREQAHELLDRLPESQLVAVRVLLEAMLEPASNGVGEPMTDEDVRTIQEGRKWLAERGGSGIPMEEALSDFGLTLDDFPLKG